MQCASFVVASLLLVLACTATVRADEEVHDPDTIVLTNENFNSIVDNEELMLVEFYAPVCTGWSAFTENDAI